MSSNVIDLLPAAARRAAASVVPIGAHLTDAGNAERLVAMHRGRVRYCPPKRKWAVWDERAWQWDDAEQITQLAKQTVRAIYIEAAACTNDERRAALSRHAAKSESASRLHAMIDLARSEPGIPIMPDDLDPNPWLLNCANGMVDLRTGALRVHDPAELCTRMTGVEYYPGARSDEWDRFVSTMTGGDVELAAFLQRWAGYCATGRAIEKHFAFFFGPKDTSKSTFVVALHGALGGYAESTAFDTWLEHRDVGGNRGDIVRLLGARLVSSVEVKRGKAFDEQLLKNVTGGGSERLTYAAKYEGEVSFAPRFKLVLAANDAPRIPDGDDALWSRCLRVPFVVPIPESEQDRTLQHRLADPSGELARAVLAWIVRGAAAWHEYGLGIPASVRASTAAYRREQDLFADFVADCCALDGSVERSALRRAYETWAKDNGVRYPLGPREYRERLERLGCASGHTEGRRMWRGIRLRGAWEQVDE